MSSSDRTVKLLQFQEQVPYNKGLLIQSELYETVLDSRNEQPGGLILLEHTPVITNGRFGDNGNYALPVDEIKKQGVEVVSTDRGGDVTYHGPGQLVAYPILNLRKLKIGVKVYIHKIEQLLINLLRDYEIKSDRREGYPGVWVGDGKIASIGVAVKKGITLHGSALNINTDLSYFSLIVPCGIPQVAITSMSAVKGEDVDFEEVCGLYAEHFEHIFGVTVEYAQVPDRAGLYITS